MRRCYGLNSHRKCSCCHLYNGCRLRWRRISFSVSSGLSKLTSISSHFRWVIRVHDTVHSPHPSDFLLFSKANLVWFWDLTPMMVRVQDFFLYLNRSSFTYSSQPFLFQIFRVDQLQTTTNTCAEAQNITRYLASWTWTWTNILYAKRKIGYAS